MRKIILMTLLGASLMMTAKGQTLVQDSTLNHLTYADVALTDSSSYVFGLPLKLHIDITNDQGDSSNGALLSYTLYSMNPKTLLVISSGQVPIQHMAYEEWDANDPKAVYVYIQGALAGKGILINFL